MANVDVKFLQLSNYLGCKKFLMGNATTVAPSLPTHGLSVLRCILVPHRDPELQDDGVRG